MTKPVKVVIVTSTLPISDSDPVPAFVKEQAIHLKKLEPGLDIIMHAPHNQYSRTFEGVEQNDFYREVRFHYFWPFRFELLAGRGILPALKANKLLYIQIPFLVIFQFLSLWRLARREKPNLIYAHWFTPQAITTTWVSRITGIPFVFTTHASDVSVLRRVPFANPLVQSVCRSARSYTAVSDRTAQRLRGFFSEADWLGQFSQKLSIVPMGVVARRTALDKGALMRFEAKYSVDGKPVILFLGRLVEKKGVAYLLEALSLLSQTLRDSVQVIIAGDGQLKYELEIMAANLNLSNVTFAGHVFGAEKDVILALADFLCLPSIIDSSGDSEGFPVVLMEGLAAGKIILASDVSGGETILQDGADGFLFEQRSSHKLAAALSRALTLTAEEAKALRDRSYKLSGQFSWDELSKKYYDILKGAANHGV